MLFDTGLGRGLRSLSAILVVVVYISPSTIADVACEVINPFRTPEECAEGTQFEA